MSGSRRENRVRLGLLALLHLGGVVVDPRSRCEAEQLRLIGDRRATAAPDDVQARRTSERRLIFQVSPCGRFDAGWGCRSGAQRPRESGCVSRQIVVDLRAHTRARLPVYRDERAAHGRGQDDRERDRQPSAQPELPDWRMRQPAPDRRSRVGGAQLGIRRPAVAVVACRGCRLSRVGQCSPSCETSPCDVQAANSGIASTAIASPIGAATSSLVRPPQPSGSSNRALVLTARSVSRNG